MNVIDLTKALISCPSITPRTAGVFDVLEDFLVPLGFVAHRVTFEGDGGEPTENIYLRYGTALPNFCFAGHTDVVPVGDVAAWKTPAFAPQIVNGELIGRGAEDMKGAVAAFMVAAREFLASRELSVVSGQASVVSEENAGTVNSPLGGESTRSFSAAVRGNSSSALPPTGLQGQSQLPPKGGAAESGIGAAEEAAGTALETPDAARATREFMGSRSPVGSSQQETGYRLPDTGFSISLLITNDEEGNAINGTRKMLGWLAERGEVISHCLVGEPTNVERLGDMVKIGRRGSIGFDLTVEGKQGHVAYPERADNPLTRLVAMLHALKTTPLDAGTDRFPPSNLEITSVDVGNPTTNIIPARGSAKFNVRFNDRHTAASIEQWVRDICAPFGDIHLQSRITGEAFLTQDAHLVEILVAAVEEVTGITPTLSTTGGTSDARFIKDVCPVIEFGTTGKTAHMVNERVEIATLEGLATIYQRVLERYFS